MNGNKNIMPLRIPRLFDLEPPPLDRGAIHVLHGSVGLERGPHELDLVVAEKHVGVGAAGCDGEFEHARMRL